MISAKMLKVGSLPSRIKSIKLGLEADISNIKVRFYAGKAKTKLADLLFNRFSSKRKMDHRGTGFSIQSVTIELK